MLNLNNLKLDICYQAYALGNNETTSQSEFGLILKYNVRFVKYTQYSLIYV